MGTHEIDEFLHDFRLATLIAANHIGFVEVDRRLTHRNTHHIVDLIEGYDLNVQFSYDDEITLSSLVAGNESKTALFCYSLMINAFDDVVCIPGKRAKQDRRKEFLASSVPPAKPLSFSPKDAFC